MPSPFDFDDPERARGYAAGPGRFVPGFAVMHRLTLQLLREVVGERAHVLVLGAGGGPRRRPGCRRARRLANLVEHGERRIDAREPTLALTWNERPAFVFEKKWALSGLPQGVYTLRVQAIDHDRRRRRVRERGLQR